MGELVTAIARYNQRSHDQEMRSQVIEEIADVKIMMEQLALIFGKAEVEKKEEEKLARLEQRIEKEF